MPTRKELKRTKRQRDAAALYLHGENRRDIAKRLGVSLATVGRDMASAEQDLKFQAADAMARARRAQQDRCERVRAAAWSAWERSQQPFKMQRQERGMVKVGEELKPTDVAGRVIVTQEERVGDPRFLEVYMHADEREARLLGLFAQPEVGGEDVPVKPGDVLVIRVASNLV